MCWSIHNGSYFGFICNCRSENKRPSSCAWIKNGFTPHRKKCYRIQAFVLHRLPSIPSFTRHRALIAFPLSHTARCLQRRSVTLFFFFPVPVYSMWDTTTNHSSVPTSCSLALSHCSFSKGILTHKSTYANGCSKFISAKLATI